MDTSEFKNFMADVPTCVAIVATITESGLQACTVSSVTSFDIQRPGMMIVLQSNSRTLKAIKESGTFSANILDINQVPLAVHFSSKEKDLNFGGKAVFEIDNETIMPFLKNCKRVVFCKVEKVVNLENSSVVFGNVMAILSSINNTPLIYFRRKYFALGDLLA